MRYGYFMYVTFIIQILSLYPRRYVCSDLAIVQLSAFSFLVLYAWRY